MVFHCRCLSFSLQEEEEEEEEYETATEVQSTSTLAQTFYTASSNLNPFITDSQPNWLVFANDLNEFRISELKAATNNFSRSAKIGEGGFGCVYMAVIWNPQDSTKRLDVAVKQLSRRAALQRKEWVREVNVLGVVDHPNLVKLVGYCAEDGKRGIQRLLVYEYMPNRSVEDHLSTRSKASLSWTMRLKVAQDVARGLTHLHEEMDFQIIFGDFKSSNVLLDDQWNAKLSDFGLARLGPGKGLTRVSTTVLGTTGYMAPEYITTGQLTTKNDVWSYGIFLYELITGRPPFDWNRAENDQDPVEWVMNPYIGSERLQVVIDPRLEDNYSIESAQNLSLIANRCLSRYAKSRPKMSEVLEMVSLLITEVPSLSEMVFTKTPPEKMMKNEVQHKKSACFSRICCVS